MKKFFKIWGLFFKSFFVCLHLPGDLKVDELITKCDDEESLASEKLLPYGFEHWNCACTCKCGEKVEQRFSFSLYLGDPATRHKVRK